MLTVAVNVPLRFCTQKNEYFQNYLSNLRKHQVDLYRAQDDEAHILRRQLGSGTEHGVLINGVRSVEKDNAGDCDVEKDASEREGVHHRHSDCDNEHDDHD